MLSRFKLNTFFISTKVYSQRPVKFYFVVLQLETTNIDFIRYVSLEATL